jgi:hypothetical protein
MPDEHKTGLGAFLLRLGFLLTGFSDYQSKMRGHFPHMSDLDIGKAWMRMRGKHLKANNVDYILLHPPNEEPKRHDDEITLLLICGDRTFTALVRPDLALIDEMVRDWGEVLGRIRHRSRDLRAATRDLLLEALLTNRMLEPMETSVGIMPEGVMMAYAMAWLIFTSPASEILKVAVPARTHDIFGYDITEAVNSTPERKIKSWRMFFQKGPLDLAGVRAMPTPAWERSASGEPRPVWKTGKEEGGD